MFVGDEKTWAVAKPDSILNPTNDTCVVSVRLLENTHNLPGGRRFHTRTFTKAALIKLLSRICDCVAISSATQTPMAWIVCRAYNSHSLGHPETPRCFKHLARFQKRKWIFVFSARSLSDTFVSARRSLMGIVKYRVPPWVFEEKSRSLAASHNRICESSCYEGAWFTKLINTCSLFYRNRNKSQALSLDRCPAGYTQAFPQ